MYSQLRKGQRYLFCEKAPYHKDEIQFRANFVNILGTTLLVNSSETEYSPKTILSIPIEWITNIESLNDILYIQDISFTTLPNDVLDIIDCYI